jgi:hypothetical protein
MSGLANRILVEKIIEARSQTPFRNAIFGKTPVLHNPTCNVNSQLILVLTSVNIK